MIAIIPARGGSKGLPGKNCKILLGKPLIAYTIEAALNSKYIDKVVVTTDDDEIADTAKRYGAEIPFMRPKELATDTAQAVDVYIHAAENLGVCKEGDKFIVLLPTTPLRTARYIDEAVELFEKRKATTLISVTKADTPISWYMNMNNDGIISNANYEEAGNAVKNRQVNKVQYIPNGAIYILDYCLLKNNRTYYCDNTVGYVMDKGHSIDIDDVVDFYLAESLMKCNDIP